MEEVLVFNWEARIGTYKLFKFLHSFTYFVDLPHGSFTHSAFKLLKRVNLDFTLITDVKYHAKILTYFTRYNIFTIGLIPLNYNPWEVSYPIPVHTDSLLTQFSFIHIIFYLRSLLFISRA
jgi:hypothetical protein